MEWLVNLEEHERTGPHWDLIELAEHLLRTSSYPDDEWKDILDEMQEMNESQCFQVIYKIKRNQLCPIQDIGRYSSTQAIKHAVKKEEDGRHTNR